MLYVFQKWRPRLQPRPFYGIMATSLHNWTQATTWQSGKVSLVNSRKIEKINKFFSTSATLALVQLGCKAGAEPFPQIVAKGEGWKYSPPPFWWVHIHQYCSNVRSYQEIKRSHAILWTSLNIFEPRKSLLLQLEVFNATPARAAEPPQRAKKKANKVGRPVDVVINACKFFQVST